MRRWIRVGSEAESLGCDRKGSACAITIVTGASTDASTSESGGWE